MYSNNLDLLLMLNLKYNSCLLWFGLQIGFEMIDVFAESVGIQMNLVNFKAIMGQGCE